DVSLSDNHSTRELCGLVLQHILFLNPSFMITNPDLSSSTKIKKNSDGNYDKDHHEYCNISVGVREFAAMGIVNGMCAHQGLKGITAAFLSFSDYNKAAIRIAALSHYPTISFFSHDSIAVGEDGPSHQPIEQINALRLIPNTYVFRPCNVDEVISCLKISTLNKQTPSCIITSRQAFKNYYSNNLTDIDKGGYIFEDDAKVQIIIIATGSEIQTAIEAKRIIQSQVDLGIRIVSMPCTEIFENQTEEYKNKVLCLDKKYIFSIELGSTVF
ncbi:transketolase, partial [bacterium]|nr:transketolase [bacterium]